MSETANEPPPDDTAPGDTPLGDAPLTAEVAAAAARSLACVLDDAETALQPADCHALLAAWLDAAAAVAAARGPEGLGLLSPIARLLSRKAVQRRDSVAVIADAVRHVAARLAADPSLGRALVAPAPTQTRHRPRRGLPGPGIHDPTHNPGNFAFHAS